MIWVNGRPAEYIKNPKELQMFSEYAFGSRQAGCVSAQSPPLPSWDRMADNTPNTIRLGEVSTLGYGTFPRNQSADMTLDEFHMWRINEPFSLYVNGVEVGQANVIQDEVIEMRQQAVLQWSVGRYYRPIGDAVYTSPPLYMGLRDRRLAPPGHSKAPRSNDVITGVSGAPAPRASHSTVTETKITADAPQKRTRLLGCSWTWHPEEVSRVSGRPIALDYRPKIPGQYGAAREYVQSDDDEVADEGDDAASDAGYRGAGALDLAPSKSSFKWSPDLEKMAPFVLQQADPHCTVELRVVSPAGQVRRQIVVGGKRELTNDGFTQTLDDVTKRPTELSDDDALQYVVRFNIQGLQSDSILLGTPVFDDITFYFASDDVEYLSWTPAEPRR